MSGEKRVFAKFYDDDILRESGRLLFSLLYSFLSAGYEVQLFSNVRKRFTEFYKCSESDLPPPAKLVLSLDNLVFVDSAPRHGQNYIYIFDRPDNSLSRQPWRKRIQVRYDLFSAYRMRKPVISPYPVHPAQAQWALPPLLSRHRETPRRLRVLFAGDSNGYKRNRVRYPKPKLPRLKVLTTLVEGIPNDVITVRDAEQLDELCGAEFIKKFIMINSGTGIENARWLRTVATADFFLCPPGIVMPMCHNVIEAMAVGTIPIISYPEWLNPKLKHLENCLVFDGEEDLIEQMRLALAMDERTIVKLRENAMNYYDSYLQPEAVVTQLEAREDRNLTLLVYTERNMAKNFSKLNMKSVLLRGPEAAGKLSWATKLIDRLLSLPLAF